VVEIFGHSCKFDVHHNEVLLLKEEVLNNDILSIDSIECGTKLGLREGSCIEGNLFGICPLLNLFVVDTEMLETLHMSSCEIKLSSTFLICRRLACLDHAVFDIFLFWFRLLLFFSLFGARRRCIFFANNSEFFLGVGFNFEGVLLQLFAVEILPVFGMMSQDLVNMFMIFFFYLAMVNNGFVSYSFDLLR
jgi:hypothetical protein